MSHQNRWDANSCPSSVSPWKFRFQVYTSFLPLLEISLEMANLLTFRRMLGWGIFNSVAFHWLCYLSSLHNVPMARYLLIMSVLELSSVIVWMIVSYWFGLPSSYLIHILYPLHLISIFGLLIRLLLELQRYRRYKFFSPQTLVWCVCNLVDELLFVTI